MPRVSKIGEARYASHSARMAELVQGDRFKTCWRDPRGFEPHSVHSPCSSMAEQLSFQANDGGSIPSMDALVDAKTTISVFGRVVMATVSRSVGEIRAGSNPAARRLP